MRFAVKNKFNLKIIIILFAIYARVNSAFREADDLDLNGNNHENYVFITERYIINPIDEKKVNFKLFVDFILLFNKVYLMIRIFYRLYQTVT